MAVNEKSDVRIARGRCRSAALTHARARAFAHAPREDYRDPPNLPQNRIGFSFEGLTAPVKKKREKLISDLTKILQVVYSSACGISNHRLR